MMQLILGLGNKARHGKDTFAAAIDRHYANQHAAAVKHGLAEYKPIVVQTHAFADALYKEVNLWLASEDGKRFRAGHGIMLPFTVESGFILPYWVQPTFDAEVSPRAPYGKHSRLLQWWGTEYRRTQDPDYWVKQWKVGINPKADIVLCPDMRFINEAQAVKRLGGYTIQVNRLNPDSTKFVDPSRSAGHPSEIQLDGYDFDFYITAKTGDLVLLEDWSITLVRHLRALKGSK